MNDSFPCYLVEDSASGPCGRVAQISPSDLPEGDLLLEIEYSSLNYKDAMACKGNRGVAPNLPHVPGIDGAGKVIQSDSPRFEVGDHVLVTGYDFGAKQWGGFSRYARIPAAWAVPLPSGMQARDAMLLGTAGFTAAQCVMAITHRIRPEDGPVVVTGATGGVGSLSVAILARLGYEAVAVTGKPQAEPTLLGLGAARVVGREALQSDRDKPLAKATWASAIDTVGGRPLEEVLRATRHRGVVAACGLVAGESLELTLYPFLLRGVTLAGIDSAQCPYDARREVWRRLAGPWRVELPPEFVSEVSLRELPDRVERLLSGEGMGRTLVRPGA